MSQSSNRAQRRAAAHTGGRRTRWCNHLEVTSHRGVVFLAVGDESAPVAIVHLERPDLEALIDGLLAAYAGEFVPELQSDVPTTGASDPGATVPGREGKK